MKQLGTKAGKVYITAQASSYAVSALTTVVRVILFSNRTHNPQNTMTEGIEKLV